MSIARLRTFRRWEYPDPPSDLTPEQREIWRKVMRSRPPEWWDEASIPLLVQYVRAIDLADVTYARAMSALAEGDATLSAHWLRLYDSAVKTVRSLATSQRLSQSSSKDGSQAARKIARFESMPSPPWLQQDDDRHDV